MTRIFITWYLTIIADKNQSLFVKLVMSAPTYLSKMGQVCILKQKYED